MLLCDKFCNKSPKTIKNDNMTTSKDFKIIIFYSRSLQSALRPFFGFGPYLVHNSDPFLDPDQNGKAKKEFLTSSLATCAFDLSGLTSEFV